ncbi:MAG: lytic transglycosylase domain-containing protein [Methylococcales bacterium]|nr:lytic transglycosylase domain-containing protein [Methylococcales bacterium]
MLKNLIKACIFISMLTVFKNLYAGYNITINVNGKEYYSDQNGFSKNNASVNGAVSTRARRKSTRHFATENRGNYALNRKERKYADLIARAAYKHQVDAKLVHAVIRAESAYNATAISSAGAVGLMQLMPGTARRFGVADRRDPYQNIDGGTRYLKHLLRLFDSDLSLAVAAYNAGENAVIKNRNAIPPYAETRHYVQEVLSSRNTMKRSPASEYAVSSGPDTSGSWGGYTIEMFRP